MTIALNQHQGRPRRAAPTSVMKTVEPPIGGLNTRDALDNMDAADAIVLRNWFPSYGFLEMRPGHAQHATGIGTAKVDMIKEFHIGSTQKLIASGTESGSVRLYDATSTGAATQLLGSLTDARFNTAIMNGKMSLVNGSDNPLDYDGTTMAAATISGSGLTIGNLFDVMTFKTRNFYLELNSQSFWYSAVNAHAGVLVEFPLSRVLQFGGNLVTMATLTLDAGNGPDDMIAFISSAGEVIVYAGTDPSDAAAWAIVGRYKMAAPIDSRAKVQVGNDTLLCTGTDYVPLSNAFSQGKLILAESKISGAARQAFRDHGGKEGWEALLYAKANMIIINVPRTNGTDYVQHVQNTTTGAWCTFEGLNASTWGTFNKNCFLGKNDGVIYQFDNAENDAGSNIQCVGQTAWNNLKIGGEKHLKAVRPLLSAQGTINAGIGVGSDFEEYLLSTQESLAVGSPWETSLWDVADWASENLIRREWNLAESFGNVFSTRVDISTKNQVLKWLQTNYLLERGYSL